MILISLDIDGVLYLHNTEAFDKHRKELLEKNDTLSPKKTLNEIGDITAVDLFDREALSNLNQLIKLIEDNGETVGILLHTDWRTKGTVAYLKDIFKQHSFSVKIIDKIADKGDKAHLVEKWVADHKLEYGIKNYIVLEDQLYKFPKEHLVLCNQTLLFDKNKLKEAINILKRTIKIEHDEKTITPKKLEIISPKSIQTDMEPGTPKTDRQREADLKILVRIPTKIAGSENIEKNNAEYKNIFRFVSLNKILPETISAIKPDDEKVNQLFMAITSGNANDKIFSDPDCHVYLLYLIEKNKISMSLGMTIYAYLMALMQFTEKQPLRPEDGDVKLVRPITIDPLTASGKITVIGQDFINKICENFAKLEYPIDKEKLAKFILELSSAEQWLLKIPYIDAYNSDKSKLHDADRLASPLRKNMPFIIEDGKPQKEGALEKGHYWVPSITIINYLLREITPHPIKMFHSFGTIGLDTLAKMHQSGNHPVPLYSTYIKSNPKKADTYRCGPFLMWLHDIGHTFWGSLLDLKDRDFIFNHFVPQLELLKKEAKDHKDTEVTSAIDDSIRQACDFDLTDIRDFISKDYRLINYLKRTFRIYPYVKVEFEDIGSCKEDRLYFLLKKMHHSTFFQDKLIEKRWDEILRFNTGTYYRRTEVVNTLDIFVKISTNDTLTDRDKWAFSSLIDKEINWLAWLEILNAAKSSEEIWKKVVSNYDRRNELAILAINYRIAFFEPYLPLAPEKLEQFKLLIHEKIKEKEKLPPPKVSHLDYKENFSFYNPFTFDFESSPQPVIHRQETFPSPFNMLLLLELFVEFLRKTENEKNFNFRNKFIMFFSQNKLTLPEKCAALIVEYDDSRQSNPGLNYR